MVTASEDEEVPKLPRGRGMKLSTPELVRIAMTLAFLVAVVVMTKPCSSAVSTFVMGFGSGSGSARAGSGSLKDPYERLTPGMSEQQVKDAIQRSKNRNDLQNGSGSAAPESGSGSSAPGSAVGRPARAIFTPPPAADGSNSLTNRRAAGSASEP